MATHLPSPTSQGLPSISSLTNGLPRLPSQLSPDHHSQADSTRDSGTWPQPLSSLHNSTSGGLQVHTLLNPDDSPPRTSVPSTPLSARVPNSARSGGGGLPSINQGFHDPLRDSVRSHDSLRDSRGYESNLDSRRSSVDSRMHHMMSNFGINNPTSPHESANTSQVSLAASLRKPNNAARPSVRGVPRVAPPIVPVGRRIGGPEATAARPTQGFAWAFPDEAIPEERQQSGSDDSGLSRTNSFAASSIRSSIFSTDSHLPPGQRRLEEDHGTTHHHTMQHRAVQSLQLDGVSSPGGVGNYSRTPELRVSHKMAERKRRSEMKDLFEDLNKAVPSNGGAKASKWEILSKAIEYIRSSQHIERTMHTEVQRLQRDSDYGRDALKENDMLKTEMQVMHQHLRRLDPNGPHIYGHFTSQLNGAVGPAPTNGASTISLPPLNSSVQPPLVPFGGAAAHMQGVEFGYAR